VDTMVSAAEEVAEFCQDFVPRSKSGRIPTIT
jgi:hypothetical protein